MPLLGTYSAGSIRGWRAGRGGGGIVTPGTLVTATWNDDPTGRGVEDTLAWYSTDNQQWASTNFYNNEAYAMAYDGQTLLAVGGDGRTSSASFSISTDNGLTWQPDTLVTPTTLFTDALFYSDRYGYFTDVFLVVGFYGDLWTIKDSVATRIGSISYGDVSGVAYTAINWGLLNNNTGEIDTLLVTGRTGIWSYVPPAPGYVTAVQSPTSWQKTYEAGQQGGGAIGLATSQSLAVAIVYKPPLGQNVVYTTDNINWQTANISSPQNPQCIVWDSQRFVVATREGTLYTSTNGADWTLLPLSLDLQYGIPTKMIWNGSNIWGVISQSPPPFNIILPDYTKSLVFRLSSDLTTVDYETLDTGFIKSIINITPGQPSKG